MTENEDFHLFSLCKLQWEIKGKSHFFNFEVVYLAEKSIFFDETFFVATGYPSSTKLPIFTGIRLRRKNPHAIHFVDPPPQPESQITTNPEGVVDICPDSVRILSGFFCRKSKTDFVTATNS